MKEEHFLVKTRFEQTAVEAGLPKRNGFASSLGPQNQLHKQMFFEETKKKRK